MEDGELTKYEVAAMWLFHDLYAQLGLSAIEFWQNIGKSKQDLVRKMVEEIEAAEGKVG